MKTDIIQLTDKADPRFTEVVKWNHAWWGEPKGKSLEEITAYMENCLCRDRIPQTYAILVDGVVAGTYQILMNDCDTRPDIYPWIGKVYVNESMRGRGLSRHLMNHAAKVAKGLGLEKIYLRTNHVGLYEKFGWEYIGDTKIYRTPPRFDRVYELVIK